MLYSASVHVSSLNEAEMRMLSILLQKLSARSSAPFMKCLKIRYKLLLVRNWNMKLRIAEERKDITF